MEEENRRLFKVIREQTEVITAQTEVIVEQNRELNRLQENLVLMRTRNMELERRLEENLNIND